MPTKREVIAAGNIERAYMPEDDPLGGKAKHRRMQYVMESKITAARLAEKEGRGTPQARRQLLEEAARMRGPTVEAAARRLVERKIRALGRLVPSNQPIDWNEAMRAGELRVRASEIGNEARRRIASAGVVTPDAREMIGAAKKMRVDADAAAIRAIGVEGIKPGEVRPSPPPDRRHAIRRGVMKHYRGRAAMGDESAKRIVAGYNRNVGDVGGSTLRSAINRMDQAVGRGFAGATPVSILHSGQWVKRKSVRTKKHMAMRTAMSRKAGYKTGMWTRGGQLPRVKKTLPKEIKSFSGSKISPVESSTVSTTSFVSPISPNSSRFYRSKVLWPGLSQRLKRGSLKTHLRSGTMGYRRIH